MQKSTLLCSAQCRTFQFQTQYYIIALWIFLQIPLTSYDGATTSWGTIDGTLQLLSKEYHAACMQYLQCILYSQLAIASAILFQIGTCIDHTMYRHSITYGNSFLYFFYQESLIQYWNSCLSLLGSWYSIEIVVYPSWVLDAKFNHRVLIYLCFYFKLFMCPLYWH